MTVFGISAIVVIDDYLLPMGMITKRDILEHIANLQDKLTPLHVQISSKIKALDKKGVSQLLNTFLDERREMIGEGNIYVYFKRIGMASDPQRMVQCRIHIHTDQMGISLHSEGLDEFEALDASLRKFDNLLMRNRK